MISPDLALRAAAIIEREAAALRSSHAVDGEWPADDPEAQQDHDEMLATAAELRRCAS